MNRTFAALALAAAITLPTAAAAETVPLTRLLEVSFTGEVIGNGDTNFQVRLSDGTVVPWSGPLPATPYAIGDTVTFTYSAFVPTQAFYDPAVYSGPAAQDGLYTVQVQGTIGGGVEGFDLSGPIDPTLNAGQAPALNMTLLYDIAADRYFIDQDGGFSAAAFAGPGYLYDANLGSYSLCNDGNTSISCSPSASIDPVLFGLDGDGSGTLRTGLIPVNSTDPFSPEGTGFFEYIFGNGSWSLPQLSTREPTQVPAPGMLLLFGFGAFAATSLRRRRRLVQ